MNQLVIQQADVSSSSNTALLHPRQQHLGLTTRRGGPVRLLRGLLAACFQRSRSQVHPPRDQTHNFERAPDHQQKPQTKLAQRTRAKKAACRDGTFTVVTAVAAAASPLADGTGTGATHHHLLPARRRMFFGSLLRTLSRLLKGLGRAISPKGPGDNDASALERVLNVLTCIPFFIVGRSFLRGPPSAHFAQFGQAMRCVGVVASLYHASSGKARLLLRKLDYWSIACASALLRRAVVGPLPQALALGMTALVSLKPTLVTTANLVAVEAMCLANVVSLGSSSLLLSWAQHAGISLAAIVSFGVEGKLSKTALGPFVHASWHCLAAGGMLTSGMLLAAVPVPACPSTAA